MACLNRSRTFAAPMPTNISTNSEPEMEKNGTFASPATALASSVLPVPGGPTSSAPLGIFAPISSYFFGLCRKSTISERISLASSSPATSSNLMPLVDFTYTLALLLPMPNIMLPAPPPAFSTSFLLKYWPRPIISTSGSAQDSRNDKIGDICSTIWLSNFAPLAYRRAVSSGSSIRPVLYSLPSPSANTIWLSSIITSATCLSSVMDMNWS